MRVYGGRAGVAKASYRHLPRVIIYQKYPTGDYILKLLLMSMTRSIADTSPRLHITSDFSLNVQYDAGRSGSRIALPYTEDAPDICNAVR